MRKINSPSFILKQFYIGRISTENNERYEIVQKANSDLNHKINYDLWTSGVFFEKPVEIFIPLSSYDIFIDSNTKIIDGDKNMKFSRIFDIEPLENFLKRHPNIIDLSTFNSKHVSTTELIKIISNINKLMIKKPEIKQIEDNLDTMDF